MKWLILYLVILLIGLFLNYAMHNNEPPEGL
jgi:hypothetical protein